MAPLSQGGVFVVPRGEAEYGTALRLAAEGRLPLSPWLLRLGLGLTALAGDIQLGEYSIPSGLSAYQVLFMLRRGKVKQHSLTFPEGWRLADWLAQLEAHPALVQDTAGLSEAALARRLGMHASLEGWLFPDTYWFAKGDSALGLLHRAHARMQQRLAQLWRADLALAGLGSPYELLILASIIEKETGRPEDQELVASVFHNRLALAMKLQSDPTVIYALGEQFDGNLTRSHLQLDHPYNTYARAGLPPTPICMPGLGALQAAASPASTGYLYFVAKGNGKSYFSVTLEEHNRAVARYQLKQGR